MSLKMSAASSLNHLVWCHTPVKHSRGVYLFYLALIPYMVRQLMSLAQCVDAQCNVRLTATFPAADRRRLQTSWSTKLSCLIADVDGCKQLARSSRCASLTPIR